MSFKLCSIILFVALFLSGCAQKVTFMSEKKIGAIPSLNLERIVNVGDTLYEEFDYTSTPTAQLVNKLNMSYYLGSIQMTETDNLIKVMIGDSIQYCSQFKHYIDPLVGAYDTVCFKSNSQSNIFPEVRVPSIALGSWSKLDQPLSYNETFLNLSTKGLKRELLYNGSYKGELKIQYREYFNDFARPAFYQDVSYEVKNGENEIEIKGVKILFESQGNNKLKYKVVSGFKKP